MATLTAPAQAVRKDAAVIGLVGIAHSVSHFSQLLLAPRAAGRPGLRMTVA